MRSLVVLIVLAVLIFGLCSTVIAQTVTEIRLKLSQALQQAAQYENELQNLLAEANEIEQELHALRQQLQSYQNSISQYVSTLHRIEQDIKENKQILTQLDKEMSVQDYNRDRTYQYVVKTMKTAQQGFKTYTSPAAESYLDYLIFTGGKAYAQIAGTYQENLARRLNCQHLLDDLQQNKAEISDDLNRSYQKKQAVEIEISNKEKALNTMRQEISQIQRIVSQQDNTINQSKQALIGNLGFADFLWPLAAEGTISSDYGNRMHPIFEEERFHTGVDLAVDMGVVIKASAGGAVTLSESFNGYGLTVIIDHGHGLSTLYGHASELLVKAGDIVKANDPIALVGSTGISTGPHLHFEVRQDNQHIDPWIWLK